MIIFSDRSVCKRCETPLTKRTNQAVRDAVGEAAVGQLDIRLDDVDGSRSFLRVLAPQ